MKFPHFPRQPLPGLFLSGIAGILAAEYLAADTPTSYFMLALLLLSGWLAIRRRSTAAIFLFTACTFFLLHEFTTEDNPGRELASAFQDKPLAQATGIVISAPQEKQTSRGDHVSGFQLRLESLDINNTTTRTDAVVLVKWSGESPGYGDHVSVMGIFNNIPPPRNPGEFDYAGYMNRLGIYSEISMLDPTSGTVLDGGHGNPVVAAALKARRWIQQKLLLDLEDSPNSSGLIQGLTLGLKSETPEEIKDLFQRTGTLHLFVVNGLHIGMFTAIVFLFVRLLGAGRALSIIVVIPLVCFYALLTGSSTGSIRAAIMAAILLSGKLVDGRPAMLNNLAAAGLAILSWNTNELFMPGFQFSFGVVFTIIALSGWLQRFFGKFGRPDPFLPRSLWNPLQKAMEYSSKHVSQLLGVSTAASIGSLPFAAEYFNLLTPSSILANLVVVPVAFLILTQGILSAFFGIFSNALSIVFNNVNWALTHLILAAVSFFAQIPGGHVYVEIPDFKATPMCEFTVLDLGAASAIHLRSEGRDWLVDCGNGMEYGTTVRSYLHSRGINRLDGFVVSHGSAKFNGAASLVEAEFRPALAADSPLDDRSPARRSFHQWLAGHSLTRTILKTGDTLDISKVAKIRILYPPPDSNARVAGDKALVLRLECDGCSVLFMSESGALTERWLMENVPDLQCDVLVKNPHSSESTGFVDAVDPKVIICSSSNFTAAGRIDEAWASEVTSRGIRLFRQDETGAVNVKLNPDGFTVHSFLGNRTYYGFGNSSK